VDALASLLDGPRGRDAVLLRTVMRPPWSVRFADRAPLGVITMLRGSGWVTAADGQTCPLEPGAVAVLRGPQEFVFADDPATPPQVVVHPGPRLTTARGDDIGTTMDLGVRAWGNDPAGPDESLIGCFQMRGEISRRLLDALPTVFVLTSQDWDAPLIPLLTSEIARDEPGQQAVLDRLFDLLLVAVLRAFLVRLDGDAPAWFRAHRDPVVGRAVRMLHDDPARPWSVSTLAAASGVSRAKFASRFSELVGEPPMSYLTSWRLALAADLLHEPGVTIESVARRSATATASPSAQPSNGSAGSARPITDGHPPAD
jgi:AraC-like DNA-binding protein